ncbi:hypothetical protein CVT25_013061 [Psilocybe cyanescens]|uniref:Protein kinase domain-containing protein n=1 Tax=Psilocybe cyanescens TaxID=93625 RepID=A0A409XSN4_PSICY|nr:hypothetical protein CVT25_013061 [Psilocybe cyanescens]
MLPSSPLRQRPLFPINTNTPAPTTLVPYRDNDSLQSPYNPSALAHTYNPFFAARPQPITADDADGSIFLSSSSASGSFTPFFTTSTSQHPLLTPVKQGHRTAPRPTMPSKPSNPLFGTTPTAPLTELVSGSRIGVGTKRKSTPHATPLRTNTLTPLKITHSRCSDSSVGFECLAPLPAPKFIDRTPNTKAETEAYLKRQTATLTRLRLFDQNLSAVNDENEFHGAPSDSGCEMDEDEPGDALFLDKPRFGVNNEQHPRSLVFHPSVSKGKGKEVAEAVSPGGHISKRRARSRPVSAELREHAFKVPKSPTRQSGIPTRVGTNRPRHSGPVAFPSTAHRGRASPGSASSSDAGSPRPRRRISSGSTFARPQPVNHPIYPPRPPLSRIESISAATLFFGPAIPATAPATTPSRKRTTSPPSTAAPASMLRSNNVAPRPNLANRHSYAGPETGVSDRMWNAFQTRNLSPSPRSSPYAPVNDGPRMLSMDVDDQDAFFAGDEPSLAVNIVDMTRNSPSPKPRTSLQMKFKPRESVLVSDEDEMTSAGSSTAGDIMPKASMSVGSICSDEGLVTPGLTPEDSSGWPNTRVFVNGDDTHPYSNEGIDVDAFIMKTLAAASKGSGMPKKAPGTPVKKVRISYFGNDRPWQSAVASKVAMPDDFQFKKAPRKSMPAAFPVAEALIGRTRSNTAKLNGERQTYNTDTEEEEEECSPSVRRGSYKGLGMGLPPPAPGKGTVNAMPRNRWLMRRSSSGAFSSGSESTSLTSTPTRTTKGIDWQLPNPRIPLRLSPSSDSLNKASPRSTSGSSTSSIVTFNSNSPTNGKRPIVAPERAAHHLAPRASLTTRRLSDSYGDEQQPGRFERDFEEIEEVGSGEFGKVIKVQSKTGDGVGVFAIKKSKRFEGAKHRLRLREEVDILKHLSQAALTQYVDGRHPNVLAYIDSWEEDEALYIRTELCESGNLARFLWEYGRVFPRLDEARVWKIIADLSNGLRFIHNSGVIHLDLKPSNVFVTKEGRFKIGDFGMASLWPRAIKTSSSDTACSTDEGAASGGSASGVGFEREGDKLYLAPEVLQGRYGKAADVFSFGMTILETASNIVVPDQGEGWQRLRREDLSQVDLDEDSPELVDLIRNMMRTDPTNRMTMTEVCAHPVVRRAREEMESLRERLKSEGIDLWKASPLASVTGGFLGRILGRDEDEEVLMDTGA